jgi:hypothetical protein
MLLFALMFSTSAALGAILGLLGRGHQTMEVVAAILVSVGLFALAEWRFGDPVEWSWQHPIASAAYLLAPFALLFLAPAAGTAIFVGRLCAKHVAKNI